MKRIPHKHTCSNRSFVVQHKGEINKTRLRCPNCQAISGLFPFTDLSERIRETLQASVPINLPNDWKEWRLDFWDETLRSTPRTRAEVEESLIWGTTTRTIHRDDPDAPDPWPTATETNTLVWERIPATDGGTRREDLGGVYFENPPPFDPRDLGDTVL